MTLVPAKPEAVPAIRSSIDNTVEALCTSTSRMALRIAMTKPVAVARAGSQTNGEHGDCCSGCFLRPADGGTPAIGISSRRHCRKSRWR